ncbi:hypothetical protein [Mesorhizobium sp.]|uniref:hypothetical protein n=1 Tax=Mesorhizobium sp. TaxID=1871066 RepID=UPI0012245EFF|nr:hypothetical protein [Mesorhizobium sp.]TIP09219.1 MAG: hypothetical protein E5X73_28390 [Mesorhizobium sp.]
MLWQGAQLRAISPTGKLKRGCQEGVGGVVCIRVSYTLEITQSKQYAEAEWYADVWLVVFWVTYAPEGRNLSIDFIVFFCVPQVFPYRSATNDNVEQPTAAAGRWPIAVIPLRLVATTTEFEEDA